MDHISIYFGSDGDVCIAPSTDNPERLAESLRRLGKFLYLNPEAPRAAAGGYGCPLLRLGRCPTQAEVDDIWKRYHANRWDFLMDAEEGMYRACIETLLSPPPPLPPDVQRRLQRAGQ